MFYNLTRGVLMKAHLFVCTNGKDVPGKCGHKNSENLRKKLKETCSQQSWSKEVRINASGCLGKCEQGIAAVLYPQGIWKTQLQETSHDELFNLVKSEVEKYK
jgi:predicted metal-binding protein